VAKFTRALHALCVCVCVCVCVRVCVCARAWCVRCGLQLLKSWPWVSQELATGITHMSAGDARSDADDLPDPLGCAFEAPACSPEKKLIDFDARLESSWSPPSPNVTANEAPASVRLLCSVPSPPRVGDCDEDARDATLSLKLILAAASAMRRETSVSMSSSPPSTCDARRCTTSGGAKQRECVE
jgi:hypothetical protein